MTRQTECRLYGEKIFGRKQYKKMNNIEDGEWNIWDLETINYDFEMFEALEDFLQSNKVGAYRSFRTYDIINKVAFILKSQYNNYQAMKKFWEYKKRELPLSWEKYRDDPEFIAYGE
jgi:hypothetical protein